MWFKDKCGWLTSEIVETGAVGTCLFFILLKLLHCRLCGVRRNWKSQRAGAGKKRREKDAETWEYQIFYDLFKVFQLIASHFLFSYFARWTEHQTQGLGFQKYRSNLMIKWKHLYKKLLDDRGISAILTGGILKVQWPEALPLGIRAPPVILDWTTTGCFPHS